MVLLSMDINFEKTREQKYLLSLCICTMNRPAELKSCLDSIFQSTEIPDEILVSDDSYDTKPTQELVAKYPGVIYQEGPHRGLGANRNACIGQAKGSHIIFIDDDVTVPSVFFATARQLIMLTKPQTLITGYEMNYAMTKTGCRKARKTTPQNADFWGNLVLLPEQEYRAIVINATIFPSSLFREALFDEHLHYGCDEVDITQHALHLGYSIAYQDDLYVNHYPSSINREHYQPFIHASRFYATAKKYWIYEHSSLKALVYLLLAPLQLLGSEIKRGKFSIWKVLRSTTLAYRYLFTSSQPK